jgi:hypothetical protein
MVLDELFVDQYVRLKMREAHLPRASARNDQERRQVNYRVISSLLIVSKELAGGLAKGSCTSWRTIWPAGI